MWKYPNRVLVVQTDNIVPAPLTLWESLSYTLTTTSKRKSCRGDCVWCAEMLHQDFTMGLHPVKLAKLSSSEPYKATSSTRVPLRMTAKSTSGAARHVRHAGSRSACAWECSRKGCGWTG
uniref:Uncharacterized protein n=1 Tax=Cacopsylla melanoneura TaxID=428564 RepID=A0A8D8QSF6_9HEMI